MIYSLDLRTTLLLTGVLLLAAHLLALVRGAMVQAWLRTLPRSGNAGFVLLAVAAIWAWLLVFQIDLGEFSHWRTRILILIPVAFVLTVKFVDEFLSARALGMLALLAGEPLLESAWMRPETGRLALVVLAYVWIVFGMFWVGMPYTLRDQIAWVTGSPLRWKAVSLAGLLYGLLLLAVS